ncbi:MAG: undecaprenyl-phosphate glucose phosphotransferase [Burkholderiaceae bacterium]
MQKSMSMSAPVKSGLSFGLFEQVRSLTDPVIAAVMLYVATWANGTVFGPAEATLASITFILQVRGRDGLGVTRDKVVSALTYRWLGTLAVLGVLGLATGYIDGFDQRTLWLWGLVTPLVQMTAHWLGPYVYAPLIRAHGLRRAIVVGSTEVGHEFARKINSDPLGYERVVAFFDDRDTGRIPEDLRVQLAGRVDAVGDFVRANNIEQIFIALPIAAQPRIIQMINDLHNTTASIWFIADLARFQPVQPSISTIGGYPVLAVCESPFRGMPGTLKRLVDVAVAGTALILAAPVMLAVAIAIKATSAGPVIFKQRRYGLDGEEIMVYKFRSMTVTEDGAGEYRQATRNDARITPVGAFIRKTSLDELPQLINVLQGRMSVVGPRPHALAVNENYRSQIPSYMVRHKVRPGITGWAQVHGYRGGDDLDSMTKRIEFDLYYLRHWSLWLDLRIMLQTVLVVLRDPAAY